MTRLLTAGIERRVLALQSRPIKLKKRKQRKQGRRPGRRDATDVEKEEEEETGGTQESNEGEEQEQEESEEDDQGEDRDDDSPGTIAGYAAVFHDEQDPGTEYLLWEDPGMRAVERVASGCFRMALSREEDVRALMNHEPDQLLGRTGSGTCRLEEDARGLRYEVDLPDTQTGRDVAELVDRGDLTGSSFGFVVEQESWREMEGESGARTAIRTIESVRLLDVGPVTYPAYASTSTGRSATSVRALGSIEEARSSYHRWKEQQAAAVPLEARLAAIRARAVSLEV